MPHFKDIDAIRFYPVYIIQDNSVGEFSVFCDFSKPKFSFKKNKNDSDNVTNLPIHSLFFNGNPRIEQNNNCEASHD